MASRVELLAMKRPIAIPVLLLALLFGTVACSDSSNAPPSAAPSAQPTGDPVAFARCMREHGWDMADPAPGAELPQGDKNNPAYKSAEQACAYLLKPGDKQDLGPSAEELEQLRAFAVCMRENGVQITDPDATGNMQAEGTREGIVNTPAYQTCKSKLPNGWGEGKEK